MFYLFTVYDASGYYAGSVMAGNNFRHSDPQLCRDLNDEINIHHYQALSGTNRTNLNNVHGFMIPSTFLPFRVQLVNILYGTIIDSSRSRTHIIHQTACMPKSCNHYDLTQIMSYANNSHLRNNLVMKDTQLLDVRILHESYSFYTDSTFYILV